MPQADRRYGTPMHSLERFGRDALTNFLQDLDTHVNSGLKLSECDAVKDALRRIGAEIQGMPSDSFVHKLWEPYPEFQQAYDEWNGRNDDAAPEASNHRGTCRRKLTKARQKLYARLNDDQLTLEGEVDHDLVNRLYQPLERLVAAFPDKFPDLSSAIARWQRRRPGSTNPHPRLRRLLGDH